MKKTVLLIGLFVLVLSMPCMGRYFDPTIGRWLIPDPLAGKYPSISPYVYCVNNPLKFVDPDGMDVLDKLTGKRISLKRFKNISVEMVRSIQQKGTYELDIITTDYPAHPDLEQGAFMGNQIIWGGKEGTPWININARFSLNAEQEKIGTKLAASLCYVENASNFGNGVLRLMFRATGIAEDQVIIEEDYAIIIRGTPEEINNYLKDNSVELHFYIELYQNESGSWQFRNVENDREDQPEK